MALAETAKLGVEMSLSDKASRGMAALGGRFKSLNLQAATLRGGLGKIGQGLAKGLKTGALMAGAALGFLALSVKQGIDALAAEERIANQTNAVLASTKGIAGETGQAIADLAMKYSDLAAIDEDVIQQGENVLLTFTNIRKQAFEPATAAALDLSAATGRDLTTSFRTVGRALNDPVKGLAMLTRLGVQFTDTEKKKIAALVKSGHLFDAQRIVLGKLNKLYGGSATANAQGYAGAQRRLAIAVERMKKALAGPLIGPLTKLVTTIAAKLDTKGVQDALKGFGETLAGFISDENINKGIAAAQGLFTYLQGLDWGTIGAGLKIAGEAAKVAVSAFTGLPPEVQGALVTLLAANKLTGGLVASGLGDLVKFALAKVTTMTVAAGVVNVTGGVGVPSNKPTGPGAVPAGFLGLAWALSLLTNPNPLGTRTAPDVLKRQPEPHQPRLPGMWAPSGLDPVIQQAQNFLGWISDTFLPKVTALPTGHANPMAGGGGMGMGAQATGMTPQFFSALLAAQQKTSQQQTTATQFAQRQTALIQAGNETTASKFEQQLGALNAQKAELAGKLAALNATAAGTTAAVQAQKTTVVVNNSVNVSATVVAGQVTRVNTSNRMVPV